MQLEELVKNKILKEPKIYSETKDYLIHYISLVYSETKDYLIHEITYYVKKEGWAFNYDVVEERLISN